MEEEARKRVKSELDQLAEQEDYSPEVWEEVSRRYHGLADDVKIDIARSLTWMRTKGMPAVYAYAQTDDPRLTVFFKYLFEQKYPTLEQTYRALGINFATARKWFRVFRELHPDVARLYEPEEAGKKRKREALKMPPSSSNRREKPYKPAGEAYKPREMSEKDREPLEIPRGLFRRFVVAAMTGNKHEMANVLNQILEQYKDEESAIREFIERYGGGTAGGELTVTGEFEDLLERVRKDMFRTYILGEQLKMLREVLGPGHYRINPDGSISAGWQTLMNPENERIKKLEERIEKLFETLEKQREEDRFKALEEKIEALRKERLEAGKPEESKELEKLREEIAKLREEKMLRELGDTWRSGLQEIKAAVESIKGGGDPIDAFMRIQSVLKEREDKIEELKAQLEKEKDERLLSYLENLRSELQRVRQMAEEKTADPLKKLEELSEALAKAEKIIAAVRKGSTPKVESDVKAELMGIIKEAASKLTDIAASAASNKLATSAGARLASTPCPSCGQPIPIPDISRVDQIACPHCGRQFQVRKPPVGR